MKNKLKIEYIMLAIFIILTVVVIFLGVKIYNQQKISSKENTDLVIPILDDNANYDLSIDLNEVPKDEEYTFKISNYRNDIINTKKINYKLKVTNKNKVKIEIYKNDSKKNLALDSEEYFIEDNELYSKKKKEETFRIVLKDTKKLTKDDIINLKITN